MRRAHIYWVGMAIFGLAIGLPFAWGFSQFHRSSQPHEEPHTYRHPPIIQSEKAQTTPKQPNDHDWWGPEAWLLYVTVPLMIFTGLLYKSTSALALDTRKASAKALAASTKAMNLANREFEATHRPWISIKSMAPVSSFVIDDGGAHVAIEFVLENVGKSPAVNVTVSAEMRPVIGLGFGVKEQNDICERERSNPPEIGPFGHTLFPGQTFTIKVRMTIPPEDIDRLRTERGPRPKLFGPFIVGCVGYKFTFAEGHHQTGFISHLRRSDPESNSGRLFVAEDGHIPSLELILSPSYVGSFAD